MTDKWTAEKVEEVLRIASLSDVVSLDAPVMIEGEEVSTLGELQASDEPSPEEQVEKKIIGEKLDDSLRIILSEKELKVIAQRYGFNGRCKTLQQIAETFNPPITRERVRQIEAHAIRKLRKKLKESDFRG